MKRLVPARGIALLILTLFLPLVQAGEQNPADPADIVREALQREIYGLTRDRSDLLAATVQQSPQYAPARWHLGYIRDGKQGWKKHQEFSQSPQVAARLTAYEQQRAKADDTVDSQLQLADWCAAHQLPEQERAHLMRVLDLSVDHSVARERLGFVRQGGTWIDREESARDQARELASQAAIQELQPKLREIRLDLEHKSPQRREVARGRLLNVANAKAIPAIEAVFAGASDPVAIAALDALAAINDPAASLSLARFAVHWPTLEVRQAAAERLGKRPLESFVPALLASMYSPIRSQFLAATLPNGRIGYRHAFVREAQEQFEVMTLDTQVQRIARFGGNGRTTTRQAFADLAEQAQERERQLNLQNLFVTRANDRLCWVLKTATGQDLPARPDAWWQWWNEHNEVFVAGSKPTSVIQELQQVAIADYVPPPPPQSSVSQSSETQSSESGDSRSGRQTTKPASGGQPQTQSVQRRPTWAKFGNGQTVRADCLAAGTLVWTVRGPVEIEQIRLGDLVLSQDVETGELAHKAVLRTTVRPKGQLVRIEVGGEVCQTSGGHPFWVAGEGWVKSRDLRSGQVLHSTSGPVHISSVDAGEEAETYNLVVADFGTYFVGYRQVLSHDNTIRSPTQALVPGLKPE